jgi:hypothetical protein
VAREKPNDWVKRIGREWGFSSSELSKGNRHYLIKLLESVRAELPQLRTYITQATVSDATGATIGNIECSEEDIWAMMKIFTHGMFKANRDFNHGKTNEEVFPQNVIIHPLGTTSSILYRNPNAPEHLYPDTLFMDPARFLGTILTAKNTGNTISTPHPSMANTPLRWDEALFLAGYEEQCHACQYKIPELREHLTAQRNLLRTTETHVLRDYQGGDPFETHAGNSLPAALEYYRSLQRSV